MRIVRGRPEGSVSAPLAEHFTGTAWMDLLFQEAGVPTGGGLTMTTVTFAPGSRTHWHRHDAGQVLVVVAGQGWVGDRTHGRHDVRAGDVIWTPPGEDHWHGATDLSTLTHTAITLGATHWYDEPADVNGTDGPARRPVGCRA
jgi:quercetin dioxygenase-like cupin family protein